MPQLVCPQVVLGSNITRTIYRQFYVGASAIQECYKCSILCHTKNEQYSNIFV